jgi:hypothetical protein
VKLQGKKQQEVIHNLQVEIKNMKKEIVPKQYLENVFALV